MLTHGRGTLASRALLRVKCSLANGDKLVKPLEEHALCRLGEWFSTATIGECPQPATIMPQSLATLPRCALESEGVNLNSSMIQA